MGNDQLTLTSLEPRLIGRMFGRYMKTVPSTMLMKRPARVMPFLFIAAASLGVLSLVAIAENVMTVHGAHSALAVLIHPPKSVKYVEMPLSQDPVAVIFILSTLLTPIFCAHQVNAIQGIVPMNVDNYLARPDALRSKNDVNVNALNERVQKSNKAFRRLGSRVNSVLILLLSALISYLIYAFLLTKGLLGSWNATSVSGDQWEHMVYNGWWANYQHYPVLAIALVTLGTYLFYFLIKQLILGAIFARYAGYAAAHGFGIVPNMEYNSDGYWGLRRLRLFMQWTFASTITHFIATLAVFVVWLRFSELTVGLAVVVMIANTITVFQPSLRAHQSVLDSKLSYVKKINSHDDFSREEKEKYYERIWGAPNLPFRTRSTATAITIYFLLPLALAVVSSLITRK